MNKRQAKILELVTKDNKIEVKKLADILDVSQVTVRKDLDILENDGFVNRYHGYATLNDSDDINKRMAYHYEVKQRIAKKVLEIIQDGETIMVESGSCCALMALEIVKNRKDITIITNSAFIAEYVQKAKNAKVILLGGEYQAESQVMVGPLIRKCVEGFFVDKLFVGTDGFSKESGFTSNDYMRCDAVKDMAKQANNVMIVTDSVKFMKKGVVSLIDNKKISAVFTDSDIDSSSESYLENMDIKVIKA